MKKKGLLTFGLILAISGASLGVFIAEHIKPKAVDKSKFHGTLLSTPRALQPFHLLGTDQAPFDNERLKKHWTFLFFGFTHCRSMCPTTMAELGKMYRILEKNKIAHLPQVFMISLDPERDSLEQLGAYAKAFNANFAGARGTDQAVSTLTRELGIAYAQIKQQDGDDIEHTGAVMLINPRGELAAFFTTPHQAQFIAEDYMLLTH